MPSLKPALEGPVQINNAFKGVLYNLNKLLEKRFDKNIKIMNHYLQKTTNMNHVADAFAKDFATKLFGDTTMMHSDYETILNAMTRGEKLERSLRKLYRKIIRRKLEYNPFTGKSNLVYLSDILVERINK